MSNYKDADINQDNNNKVRESNNVVYTDNIKNNLEKQGPDKKHFTVLHEGGSFADLPDREIDGAGAQSASITE